MSWFDREQLETALKGGKISADEDMVSNLDKWLFVMEQIYRTPSLVRRRAPPGYKLIECIESRPPSKELMSLDEALHNWLDADFPNKRVEADLLNGEAKIETLSRSVSNAVHWLKSAATNTKQIEAIETSLLISFYRKYIQLSGSKKLSDKGRGGTLFITKCASILGITVKQENIRRRIQQAIVTHQQKTPPTSPPDFSGLFEQLRLFFPEWNNYAGASPETVKPPDAG